MEHDTGTAAAADAELDLLRTGAVRAALAKGYLFDDPGAYEAGVRAACAAIEEAVVRRRSAGAGHRLVVAG